MDIVKLEGDIYAIDGDCMIPEIEKRGLCFDLMVDHDIVPRIKGGDVIVDAGAAIGDHTVRYLQAAGARGEVHAFEPCMESFQCLSRNCPNALKYNKVLWNKDTFLFLHVSLGNVGASWVSESPDSEHGEPVQGPIEAIKLDDLALGRVDFIKLDTEGTELFVLEGALETIAKSRPWMVIEMNSGAMARYKHHSGDVYNLLDSLNYDHKSLRNQPGDYCSDCDIIAIPK